MYKAEFGRQARSRQDRWGFSVSSIFHFQAKSQNTLPFDLNNLCSQLHSKQKPINSSCRNVIYLPQQQKISVVRRDKGLIFPFWDNRCFSRFLKLAPVDLEKDPSLLFSNTARRPQNTVQLFIHIPWLPREKKRHNLWVRTSVDRPKNDPPLLPWPLHLSDLICATCKCLSSPWVSRCHYSLDFLST